jgi:hypothetical protein
MRPFPAIEKAYLTFIISRDVPQEQLHFWLKWLRYYLDFCEKYGHAPEDSGSLPHFIAKLTDKHCSDFQQAQARRAIGLYRAMIAPGPAVPGTEM